MPDPLMSDNTNIQHRLDALLSRIDELESRSALRDLVTDYCLGFDNRDWDRFIAIWHPISEGRYFRGRNSERDSTNSKRPRRNGSLPHGTSLNSETEAETVSGSRMTVAVAEIQNVPVDSG